MTKAARNPTMTGSMTDRARAVGDDLLTAGTNVLHAGVGVCAAAEDQVRDTFDRMVERGKQVEADESGLFSRATREALELCRQLERQVEKPVSATLHRIGVPDREEIERLGRRVEALTRQVGELAATRKTRTEEAHG